MTKKIRIYFSDTSMLVEPTATPKITDEMWAKARSLTHAIRKARTQASITIRKIGPLR